MRFVQFMRSFTRNHKSCALGLSILIITTLIPLFPVGCAKIADPQPPELRIPKAADDLSGKQKGAAVVLEVSLPRQNTTGSPVTTLQRVEVYRLAENRVGGKTPEQIPAGQFEKDAELLYSIPETRISDIGLGESLIFEDTFLEMDPSFVYTHAFRYALLFVNTKNQAAGFSNQIVIDPVAVPLPPDDIRIEVHENYIQLNWVVPRENLDGTKPPRISGYNVYREETPDRAPTIPLNPEPLLKPEFRDTHIEFDRTYYYRVSIVGSLLGSGAESALSKYRAVVPKDTFSPQPAENLNALQDGNAVLLLWQPSPSKDVEGYRVYRTEKSGQQTELLLAEGVLQYSFRDTAAVSDVHYVYTVEAIDRYGNRSDGVSAEITLR